MPSGKRKALKFCCFVTVIFLTILIILSITLFFTIFKPKQPQVIAHPASLENVDFQVFPSLSLNVTLGLIVTIDNRNYGGFEYKNTTAYIHYRGMDIAEVPIEHAMVPARGKLNISTYANISADKLIISPYFWDDIGAGMLNLTSTSTLHGEVCVLKVLKMGAKVLSTCDIYVIIKSQDVESKCNSKIKL